MITKKELLRGIVADSSPFVTYIDTLVIKAGKVPVNKFHLIELEMRTNRINQNISHFHIIMNNSCLVSFIQLFQQFIENERRLVMIKLQLSQHNRFFMRKYGHSIKRRGVRFTFMLSTIFCPFYWIV